MKRQKIKLTSGVSLFLFIFIFQFLPLSGQDSAPDSLRQERQQEIQKLLNKDRANAQFWWYGWLGAYSVATVGQGIVCFTTDNKATRQDMALGSATTILGALGQLVTPLVPKSSYVKNAYSIDSLTGEQYQLQYNPEEMLKEIALREKAGRSWKVHAVTGVVNIGSGLITWLGFKRTFRDGVENFILNTVITEAQIWTQPIRASKDYENYCRKYSGSAPYSLKPDKEWLVQVYPGGVAVRLRF
jgi:hypothetical protein